MTGRTWLLSCVAATIFGASGCITPGYDGAKLARNAGPSCDIPLGQRNEVFVFVIGGNNPVEMMALDKFRQGLNANGFANVATGPSIYSGWMASEMKRIHEEKPNAVFAIAGLESAAGDAARVSEKANAEGIPIRGLVIVDATGKTPVPRRGLRTLMVGTSHINSANPGVESLVITNPGQLGLSAEYKTIDQVVQLLKEIALENPTPPNVESVSDSVYPFAPDVQISLEFKDSSEWEFMFDKPGGMTRGIDEPLQLRSPEAINNTNTAGR
jgi:hypothetical protein